MVRSRSSPGPRARLRASTTAGAATLALGLALGLGSTAGCAPGGGGGPGAGGGGAAGAAGAEGGVQERRAARVLVEALVRREMLRELQTTCIVESEREVRLVPRSTGPVVEVLAEEGDRVVAGQVLARLDARDQALALRDAENATTEAEQGLARANLAVREALAVVDNARLAHEQATRDYDRNFRLRTGGENPYGSVAETAVEASRLARDKAEFDLRQAELAVERTRLEEKSAELAVDRSHVARDQAALALAYTEIVAPFDGVVADRLVKAGDTATPAEPCFVVTDPEQLRTIFYRPQRELELFAGAQDLLLTATTEARPDVRFVGRVQRTSPTIDRESGQFRVTATFDRTSADEPGATLLPGMLVRLTVVTDRRADALVAPKRAVLREGDAAHVLVVRDGAAHRVPVDEGYTSETEVELLPEVPGALAVGDRIVVVGGRDLEDGAPVEVEGEAPAEAAAVPAGDVADDVDSEQVAEGDA